LFKKNLFNGANITVTYDLEDTQEQIQDKLDEAINTKISMVKDVWEERQAKDTMTPAIGITTFKTDKKIVEVIK